ncbi:MAG TPA: thiamine pyrophosphate-dependent enzyme [Candidatus Kapabacteria bacterium]|jgi:pyruvate dehydrogenase (quinone)/pyruvate oxidase|nr:thiamine pyrophosphate-dependent enzyme [Candidatus Kapabacteria bacterium]
MAQTASDILVQSLIDWDVEVIFGLPGDGINGIMEALRKQREKINFIQVRHEEAAAFMACGYAKYTGKLGVCIATSGPGGIHLLNGLYDAKLDGVPVLAITGMQYHDLIDTYTQQDVQLDRLYMDVAKYNARVMGPGHVQNVVDLAIRTALTYRGVAHVTIPVDIQTQEVKERSERNVPHHTSEVFARGGRLPNARDIQRAAEVINAGKKVAILAGSGALHATDELEALAEKVGGPIIKPLLGKACVPDDSPYTTGGIGLLGTKPSQEALEECDTLVMIGTSFPYIEFYPKPKDVRGVQIELDPMRIGLRFPVEVGMVGDSKLSLKELLPLIERKRDRSFLETAQEGMKDWRKLLKEQASYDRMPMKPQVIASELGKRLSDTAIVSSDSGTIATWAARFIDTKRGQKFSLSGNLATMANGLPYTIAAQIAYPERECVAFVGDGGFSMLMAEFATCVKYKLPVRIVVVKNNALGMIKWEQIVFMGNPEYEIDLQPIDFAAYARACGGTAFTIDDPKTCGDILDEALQTPGPVLIEAIVDPFEPPFPPKITRKQATHFAEALLKGEPNGAEIALTVASDKVREMV